MRITRWHRSPLFRAKIQGVGLYLVSGRRRLAGSTGKHKDKNKNKDKDSGTQGQGLKDEDSRTRERQALGETNRRRGSTTLVSRSRIECASMYAIFHRPWSTGDNSGRGVDEEGGLARGPGRNPARCSRIGTFAAPRSRLGRRGGRASDHYPDHGEKSATGAGAARSPTPAREVEAGIKAYKVWGASKQDISLFPGRIRKCFGRGRAVWGLRAFGIESPCARKFSL